MTHLCYTLEETASRLNLSETVLVRLSQYFKVPKSAYEEVGYLSFKGDLAFSDMDITFFRQVKERLLAGENLEEVKSRMRQDPETPRTAAEMPSEPALPSPQQSVPLIDPPAPAVTTRTAATANPTPPPRSQEAPRAQAHPASMEASRQTSIQAEASEAASSSELREVNSRQSFQKAAEISFARYKSHHQTGLGKVFEKMLKDVGATAAKQKEVALATLRPLNITFNRPSSYPLPPEPKSKQKKQASKPMLKPNNAERPLPPANEWEHTIAVALHQPRRLNPALQQAAQQLKEHSLQTPPTHS